VDQVSFDLNVPVSPKLQGIVSRMDRLRAADPQVPEEDLANLERSALVQTLGATCRLSGMRITDEDAAAVVRGEALPVADAAAVRGTLVAQGYSLGSGERLLDAADLGRLNAVVMGDADLGGVIEPSGWRTTPSHCETFDCSGHASGRVIPILPPRMIPEKLDQLLAWFEMEMHGPGRHPVPTIGALVVGLMAISPYERGNGRTIRALTRLLLLRSAFAYTRYASIEREMESLRERYYEAFDQAQMGIWGGTADLTPWLDYFGDVLDRHRARAEANLRGTGAEDDLSPLQHAILTAVREHGTVDAGLLLRETGANRNTLKDNLRRMVDRGVLERSGQRRTARYRLAEPQTSG
jgi:Fic family protein